MIAQTLSSVPPVPHADVLAALHSASRQTGSDFDYLLATATRESSLNSAAKSKGSSATGLFQFIDRTWLGLVKRFGDRHGLGQFAAAIKETPTGGYTVAADDTKAAILALRQNPEISALMAGEAATETKQALECALGRQICSGELYAAHFLGEGRARQLIALNETDPDARADLEFPQAAKANRNIFFHADGSAKTVAEVYAWVVGVPPGTGAPAGTGTQNTQTLVASAQAPKPAQLDAIPLWTNTRAATTEFNGTKSLRFDAKFDNADRPTARSNPWSTIAALQSAPATRMAMPQSALLLSPGIVEVLASFASTTPSAAKRAS